MRMRISAPTYIVHNEMVNLIALPLGKTQNAQKSRASRLMIENSTKRTKQTEDITLKRYNNIYEKIYKIDNLKLAHQRAKKDKSFYQEVKMVDGDEEYYLTKIQDMLKNKTYSVSESDYVMFKKMDKGKEREIYKLDYFPHRIIQHALLIQIEGILYKGFINNTFASLPNRGVHAALKKLNYDLKHHDKETTYCLQIDVKKFYPSIHHDVLKSQFRRKFKDESLMWLIDMLIDSLGGKQGIAIGSLFSQWARNFNLSQFDHWMKEEKKVSFYYRYMDDVIILSNDKERLHNLLPEIKEYLSTFLHLDVKGNHKIFPVEKQGIDFVGYRHFRKYILLRKTTSKNLVRKMRDIKKKIAAGGNLSYKDYCSINSFKGWLKWCNGHNLYKEWIQPLEPHQEKYYREVIKNESKRNATSSKTSRSKR